jgi:3-deoxy-D-manno-octulosonate 8-phosphate phosphatase (KDO 8-P phosphatase)
MGIKEIKLLLTDVDGVLTNGMVYYAAKEELVGFDIQDGIAQHLATCGGLKVGWLSGRVSQSVTQRAKRLKVSLLYQGQLDKLTAARKLCRKTGLQLSQIAYIGDDLIDIPLLMRAGWSASVPTGRKEVKKAVHYVTKAGAGAGAFREVVEKILKGQGAWKKALRNFHRMNSRKLTTTDDVFD